MNEYRTECYKAFGSFLSLLDIFVIDFIKKGEIQEW